VFSSEEERELFRVGNRKQLGARSSLLSGHNQPYTPQRSFLYQFLCIASGYIPPRTEHYFKVG